MAKFRLRPTSTRRDHELEEFRDLMHPPDTFEDGFSWTAVAGAVFVALLMVPGSIYMTLIAGMTVGPAAQWVTVILFIEVARRANRNLRKAEIFTLFYLAGAIMVTTAQAQGQFHGGLSVLWWQYYAESEAAIAYGIADQLPFWRVPTDPAVLETRSIFNWQWLPAIGLVAFTMVIGRFDNMVLGYGLFRLTSDIEKLPFPMAPVGAQGIMALSEEQEEEGQKQFELEANEGEVDGEPPPGEGRWRWRVFSIGSVIGLLFGAVYIGIPTITAALLGRPITILPLPYVDFTTETGSLPWMRAVAIAISLDLGMVLLGMVLPFWAVIGTAVGLLITFVLNPILAHPEVGVLRSWNPGDDMVTTFWKNNIDFYFSFSIGVAIAIALAGFWSVFAAMRRAKRKRIEEETRTGLATKDITVPEGRGDIRWWFILAVYLVTSGLYIGVSTWLLQLADGSVYWPVVWVMVFYAFVYTPLISYVTARLEGIAGEVLNIPFVREASFILSGYSGVAVWFLPIPYHNYGQMTVFYRQCELTGTSFWSIWKSELILTPLILVGSVAFAHFIWGLSDIPGPAYPFAQELWPLFAEQQALVHSSTMGGFSEFEQALNGFYIFLGAVIGSFSFAALAWLGAPTFLIYGVVRGLNQTLPFAVIPQFVGALIGRFYFRRKLGLTWRQYVPVVFAGFSAGMGLIGTLGIGFTFLTKSVFQLPF